MNQSKAIAGGLSTSVATVALFFLHKVPFFQMLPPDVDTALGFIVATAIGYLLVYHAPANKETV